MLTHQDEDPSQSAPGTDCRPRRGHVFDRRINLPASPWRTLKAREWTWIRPEGPESPLDLIQLHPVHAQHPTSHGDVSQYPQMRSLLAEMQEGKPDPKLPILPEPFSTPPRGLCSGISE